MAGDEGRNGASPRALAGFYAILGAAVAATIALAIAAGEDRSPQPAIAGGYTVRPPSPCLGNAFTLTQSGQFVSLDNANESASAKLRFEGGKLTGEVSCQGGGTAMLVAAPSGRRIDGMLGGRRLRAELSSEPPPPGNQKPVIPSSVAGNYALSPTSTCLGSQLGLAGSSAVTATAGGNRVGTLTYVSGHLAGTVRCMGAGRARLRGEAADRTLNLTLAPIAGAHGALPERVTATKQREFGATVAAFLIAVAVIMLVARAFGIGATRLGQPRVMGEVVAGIVLGPTVLGAIDPQLQSELFPTDIIPMIGVVANLGLIFYMFMVGLELDQRQLRGRMTQALAISNSSVAVPMALGIAVAVPAYTLVGPDRGFIPFALFMGVAMSITAFPVLARILVERRMLKRPLGAVVMAAAAIDDVSAWFLIALAVAVATSGTALDVVGTIGLVAVFVGVMLLLIRPLLSRASDAYDEAGRVPSGWIAVIFAGVLLSAYATETIGVAVIFGPFVMGLVMPRHAELTEDVTRRIEDFVVTLLLPLFFVYTGLRTDVGLLDRSELVLLLGALVLVAIVGKFAGAMIAARVAGFRWPASGVIGTLMNTRGLTELIVLNLALEKGVISPALFAALVIMALVTTFMAGPVLRLIDPSNRYGAPVEEEFERARAESQAAFPAMAPPERAILVAPQSEGALAQLRALAEPLARSQPPRELILARLIEPPRAAAAGVRGGLQTENKLLEQALAELEHTRDDMIETGLAARAVAFISAEPGADLGRVVDRENVDLTLLDGRRPLLGPGVPRGPVGAVLADATSDAAVLVAREGSVVGPAADRPVVVPFGGAEHDWAALELGAWLGSAAGAPLSLLGVATSAAEVGHVSRMLGDASLLVQQYAGVSAHSLVVESGRAGIIDAAASAALLVIGLSARWRREGLGRTRAAIARAAPAPILFVRRGSRPGALAPSGEFTRFTWSAAGAGSRLASGGAAAGQATADRFRPRADG